MVLGGYLGGLAASALVDDLAPVDPGPLALALVGSYLCFLAVGGVALLVAALVRDRRPRGRLGVGLRDRLLRHRLPRPGLVRRRAARAVSIFHHLDPPAVLRTGSLGPEDVAALAGLAAVATAAALVLVGRRDLTP